jgi:hypothetical protein
VAGMLDGAISDTGGVLSANFTSLSVLFTASSLTVEAAADVGTFIGEGAGGAGSAGSTGSAGGTGSAVLSKNHIGINSSSHLVSFVFTNGIGIRAATAGVVFCCIRSCIIAIISSILDIKDIGVTADVDVTAGVGVTTGVDVTAGVGVGVATDAVAGASVVAEMSLDGAFTLEASK